MPAKTIATIAFNVTFRNFQLLLSRPTLSPSQSDDVVRRFVVGSGPRISSHGQSSGPELNCRKPERRVPLRRYANGFYLGRLTRFIPKRRWNTVPPVRPSKTK